MISITAMWPIEIIQKLNGEPRQQGFSYADFCSDEPALPQNSVDKSGRRAILRILGMLEEITPYVSTKTKFQEPFETKFDEKENQVYETALKAFRRKDACAFKNAVRQIIPGGNSAGELETIAEQLSRSELVPELFMMSLILGVVEKYGAPPLKPAEFSDRKYWFDRLFLD